MALENEAGTGGAEPPRRWNPFVFTALVGVLIAAGVACYIWGKSQPDTKDVKVVASRLTLDPDDGGNLTQIDRQAKPEVWYRVTLDHAPLGAKLTLQCDWIAPDGKIKLDSVFPTPEIDKPEWPTQAPCRFLADSPTGDWTVKLSLDGRVLSATTFRVQDGKPDVAPAKPAEKPAAAGK